MNKRNLVVLLLIASLSLSITAAAQETLSPAESYSKGPEYSFSQEKTAKEQLNDLFTTIDLQEADITNLQKEMEAGNLTSEKLTQMYLDRINAYDKALDLNSTIWINENALAEARALDEERAAGNVRGKLHGIPIVVKDNYNVSGMPTSAGAVALADLIVSTDAGTVKKLKEAGAVIIAKANLSEFACSAVDSHSTLGGDAHNAFNSERSPAGSSGGTATAVRSNFAAAGLGTDTGGSIRNPSSWSNLFGIRPSKGLTSIDGVLPLCAARDTTGPMATTAGDMAIVLEAMAGTDNEDDYTLEANADSLLGDGYSGNLSKDSLKGKRIGYLRSSFNYYSLSADVLNDLSEEIFGYRGNYDQEKLNKDETLSREIEILARSARANLRKAGAEFVDLSGELSDEELYLYKFLNDTSNLPGYSSMEFDINGFLDKFSPEGGIKTVNDILGTGSDIGFLQYCFDFNDCILAESFNWDDHEKYGYYTFGTNNYLRPGDWDKVLKYRDKISGILEKNNVDAVMYIYFESPSYSQSIETSTYYYSPSGYDRAFGPALGFPVANIPMGFMSAEPKDSGEKMPVGMELAGRFGGEKALMEIAYAYEQQAGSIIKKTPENTPPLRDEELNSYLDALMEEACALDPARYGGIQSSKMRKLYDAYDKALNADYSDPYKVYDAAYELAVAYDKVIAAYKAKRDASGTVLVKGQKLKDISASMFAGVSGINNYNSADKKIASVTKKGQITAKKKGATLINALDYKSKKDYQTLSSNLVTVIDKPKLKFTGEYTENDIGKEINANKYLISPDYDLLDIDKWVSSKPTVAEIDEKTGIITIKGKGSTRITAYFGNVKVACTLKVKKAP